jgi:hypothetical protein
MRHPSRKTRGIQRGVAGLILLACAACACGNSRRSEARALLERISAVDLHAPFSARATQVERLRALPLHDAALAAVRDQCARVHAGLLAAERAQVDARERLEHVASGQLGQTELAAIAAAVAQAGRQLQAAQGDLPACERSTRELALHAR